MCGEFAVFRIVLRPNLILRTILGVGTLISILQVYKQGVSHFAQLQAYGQWWSRAVPGPCNSRAQALDSSAELPHAAAES